MNCGYPNFMEQVDTVAQLEDAVGKPVGAMMLKTIDRLDDHCRTILAHSPAAALGYIDTDGAQRTRLIGGPAGLARAETPTRLDLPLPPDIADGAGASLLVLVPGWRETLRINGIIADGAFDVREAYLHCGKAVIRSGLWQSAAPVSGEAEEGSTVGPAAAAFLAAAPFAVISSRDVDGRADSSPRGDPAGDIRLLGPTTVAIADRPGNRRTDTLHNIVAQPDAALLILVPGDDRTLELVGSASISADEALRESLAERGRAPKAVLLFEVAQSRLAPSPAIGASSIWDTGRHVDTADLPRPSAVWTDHIKLNETGGVGSRVLRKLANERVMRAGIDLDYRQNLY